MKPSLAEADQGHSYGTMDWSPVLSGHRMEGKTKDKQIEYFTNFP